MYIEVPINPAWKRLFIHKTWESTWLTDHDFDVIIVCVFLKTWKVGNWWIKMVLIPCINTVVDLIWNFYWLYMIHVRAVISWWLATCFGFCGMLLWGN